MRLSKHFTLDEFTFSQTAIRRGLDNTSDELQIEHMRALCVNVLEPLRDVIGKPNDSRTRDQILLARFAAGRATYTALSKDAALALA